MRAIFTSRTLVSPFLPFVVAFSGGASEANASGFDAAHLAWAVQGDQPGSQFGAVVATAGDVNGDGFPDIIIGAPSYNGAAGPGCGKVFVYYGSAAGLPSQPSWSAEGEQPGEGFGANVALAGDVNGDGFSDIVVSAPGYSVGTEDFEMGLGRIYVFLGSAAGLQTTPAFVDTGRGFDLGGRSGLGQFSMTYGDFNGDGFKDLVVTQYAEIGGSANVYYGSAAGLSLTNMWQGFGTLLGQTATVADVNQDGFDDLIVTTFDTFQDGMRPPTAFVYYGSPTGLSDPLNPVLILPDWENPVHIGKLTPGGPDRVLTVYGSIASSTQQIPTHAIFECSPSGPKLASLLGPIHGVPSVLVDLGDVNGDGFDDVLGLDGNAFTIYFGSANGFDPLGSGMGTLPGTSIASAVDIFKDKRSAVLIGDAPHDTVSLYRGTPDWSFPTTADLSVSQSFFNGGGLFIDIFLTNNGPGPARARFSDHVPPVFKGAVWNCIDFVGAAGGCPPGVFESTTPDLNQPVEMAPGEGFHFQLNLGGALLGYPILNTVSVELPSWVTDPNPANNSQSFAYGGNASFVFNDDFESGSLSAWSSHTPAGVAVVPSSGIEGAFSLQATALPGVPGVVQDNSPRGQTLYHARFLLDATGFSESSSPGTCLGVIFSGHATASQAPRFQVSLERATNGVVHLLGTASTDPGTSPGVHPPTSLTPGLHLIEIAWKKATGPGTKDGFFALLLDGAVRTNIAKISNAQGGGIGFVDLGLSSGCPLLGPAPFVLEDAFESWTNPK
jgi:hypothetical protein